MRRDHWRTAVALMNSRVMQAGAAIVCRCPMHLTQTAGMRRLGRERLLQGRERTHENQQKQSSGGEAMHGILENMPHLTGRATDRNR